MLNKFHEFAQGLYKVPNFNVSPSIKRELKRIKKLSNDNPNNKEIQAYVIEKMRKLGTFQ